MDSVSETVGSYGGERDTGDGKRDDRDRDYSRRRQRSRSQERDRDRDYERRRDRSRSREQRRERDGDEGYREKRHRDNSGSRWDHHDDRDKDRSRWEERRRSDDSLETESSSVIIMRRLRDDVDKEDISNALGAAMSSVKDIRLIRKRDAFYGFAFVEFYDTQSAVKWMDQSKGKFEVRGCSRVDVEFSRNRRGDTGGGGGRGEQGYSKEWASQEGDWICFKCKKLNFSRRRFCMTCDCTREESESLHEDFNHGRISEDRSRNQEWDRDRDRDWDRDRDRDRDREEKKPPSNVLIFKGLDALSSEDSIRTSLAAAASSVQVKDVRLIRDKSTNTSRGFCFVEMATVQEATDLLEKLQNQYPAFFVDGRRVSVNYAHQSSSSGSSLSGSTTSRVASAAIAQAQWSMTAQVQPSTGWQQRQQVQQQTYSSAQSTQAQAGTWQQSQQQQHRTNENSQQAYQQAGSSYQAQAGQSQQQTYGQASSTQGEQQTQNQTTAQQQDSSQYPSTYSYDATSGFYYDSATGLYYDPKTQYHYNGQTGQYCYYDPTQQTYIPVAGDGTLPESSSTVTATATAADADAATPGKEKKKKDGTGTVTAGSSVSAKKIAKDMQRWAKSVNAAKAAQQQQLQTVIQQEKVEFAMAALLTPAVGVAPVEVKRTGIALSAAFEDDSVVERSALSTHAVEVGEPPARSPLPPGADTNPAHTDWTQLACLLCKRKFPSKEVLIKHQQFSDLHKKNLEEERKARVEGGGPKPQDGPQEIKYRDRAKERREKFGTPAAIIPGWKRRLDKEMAKGPPIPAEQPTVRGIKEDNIGNKMLQAMGWSEGEGLGRSKQGIIEPIKAERRQQSAGLGAPGSSYGLYNTAGSYKETLKQLTRARYEDVFN